MTPAKKLTITIPDGLAQRLEAYRDRLNLSAIATEAITEAIREIEANEKTNAVIIELLSKPGTLDLLRRWIAAGLDDNETVSDEVYELCDAAVGLDDEGNCKDDDLAGWVCDSLREIATVQFGPDAG